MEQFNDAPHGATGAGLPRTGPAAPNNTQPSGWRKATAGLAMAERHADAGERASVPKSRAVTAVKRVGPQIGLKPGDMLLLDTLSAFTQTQDWEAGRRPIVWASNAYLMERTGFSLSALKRHARRLTEAGVIAFRDSPNGKRWGYRDAEGVIVEAYGFDLSPLAARAEEFEQRHMALQAERTACQRMKRQITVARRMIRARLEAARDAMPNSALAQLTALFEELLDRLPRRHASAATLEQLLQRFSELQDRIESRFLDATTADSPVDNPGETNALSTENDKEMDPREIISDPHIQTTNQLLSVKSNHCKEASNPHECENTTKDGTSSANPDLKTVMDACPEFTSWTRTIGTHPTQWRDLYRSANQLGPMIGLSEKTWQRAQEKLGRQTASAALALVFEKHCAGEVLSPSGYLNGMIRKAGAGELHLTRSFYGRLSGQGA